MFNIGSGVLTSINHIIDTIEEVTKQKFKINKLPQRNFDVQSISLDCLHAKNQFNWSPTCGLKEGILDNWIWLSGHYSE